MNASLITANEMPSGTKFEDAPDVVIIFISKFDVFKEGKMLYVVDRVLRDSGTVVYNGMSEYYVNAAVQDRSTDKLADIADLMEIFVDSDKYDYRKFPKTSERKKQFKKTEKGVRAMSEGIQELIDKKADEARQKTILEAIKNVMESFGVTAEKAMESLKVPQSKWATYAGLL